MKKLNTGNSTFRILHIRSFLLLIVFAAFALPAAAQTDARATAFALEREGRNTEAEAAWRKIAAESQSNPEPLAHIGLLEARQEHYSRAVEFYRKALALDPKMPGLRLNMGLALFKGGEYREAIRVFEPMLKAQPNSPEAERLTLLLGMSHYGLGEYVAATPYLQQASTSDPQNLTLLLTLAHSCLLARQFPCVLDTYHRMVALNADSAEAHMLVGEALDEMKDAVGAMQELRAAIAANPKEPNVHFGLGYLLWTQAHYEEAATEFQKEIDNTPGHLKAMLYLGDSEIQMNRMDEAGTLLEKLVRIDPGNAKAHLDLGIVYADAGRKQDALREFERAIALKPDDVNAHWRLGRLYRTMGMTAEAKAEFNKADRLNKAADETLLKIMSKIPESEKKTADEVKDK